MEMLEGHKRGWIALVQKHGVGYRAYEKMGSGSNSLWAELLHLQRKVLLQVEDVVKEDLGAVARQARRREALPGGPVAWDQAPLCSCLALGAVARGPTRIILATR